MVWLRLRRRPLLRLRQFALRHRWLPLFPLLCLRRLPPRHPRQRLPPPHPLRCLLRGPHLRPPRLLPRRWHRHHHGPLRRPLLPHQRKPLPHSPLTTRSTFSTSRHSALHGAAGLRQRVDQPGSARSSMRLIESKNRSLCCRSLAIC